MEKENPTKYIESILKRGIDWYKYEKLDKAQWQIYFNDANSIATNETFNNELNHYITDLIKFGALESKDFDAVMNIRTAIIVLETFKKRLESIEDPRGKENQKTNPHESI